MVTIKDGCGCEPCDCDWKQKLKEAYSRAIQSVNKIGDNDGSVYFPDGTGFVKLPLPRQSDVSQIHTNTEDIANLKVRDTQLQADINAETTAREDAITAEAIAREEAIAAEASAREAKDAALDADIARIDNTDAGQDQRIRDNADRITTVNNDLIATEATVATHNTQIINLQSQTEALSKSLVSDVMMTDGTTAGSVQVSIEREDGAVVTSANYKWGRDIGVRLEAGTQAGYIKTVISLSDGTELESNEYKIVEVIESDVYVTAITLIPDMTAGTIGGTISYSNGTTQTINSINVPTAPGVTSAIETLQTRMTAVEQKNTAQDSQISAIDGRVQALEDTPGIGQFTAGKLGTIAGSTADGRVKAEDDGTGSVNGWSDLKGRLSTAEGQIVTAQNNITDLDGQVAGKVDIMQGAANAGKALIVGSDGNVTPGEVSGGEVWEEVNLSSWPTDWANGDRIKILFNLGYGGTAPKTWTTAPTSANVEGVTAGSPNPTGSIIEFMLSNTAVNTNVSIVDQMWNTFGFKIILTQIFSYAYWNKASEPKMYMYPYSYNGAGSYTGSLLSIKSDNISKCIYKMWRLKK